MCFCFSLTVRFQKLMIIILRVVLFGYAAWVWSQALVIRIRQWEKTVPNKVVGVKRFYGATFFDFINKSTRVSERFATQHYRHNSCVVDWNTHSFANRMLRLSNDVIPNVKLVAAIVGTNHFLQWEFSNALEQLAYGSNTPQFCKHATRGRFRVVWKNKLFCVFGIDWQRQSQKN